MTRCPGESLASRGDIFDDSEAYNEIEEGFTKAIRSVELHLVRPTSFADHLRGTQRRTRRRRGEQQQLCPQHRVGRPQWKMVSLSRHHGRDVHELTLMSYIVDFERAKLLFDPDTEDFSNWTHDIE
jgi:hypothetical protein